MAATAIIGVTQNGDIGGAGISRFMIQSGGSAPSQGVVDAVCAALKTFYNAVDLYAPSEITYTLSSTVQIVEDTTGLLLGELAPTTVWSEGGAGSGSYAAGVGCRFYWHTGTIVGRRTVRGATLFAPLVAAAFTTAGALSPGVLGAATAAARAYLTAAAAGGAVPVIWHRPAKLVHTGGLAVPIISVSMSPKPCSVASRRS